MIAENSRIGKLLIRYKTLTHFTFTSLLLNFSNLVSGFLVYRWIAPEFMGIWQSVTLLDTYSQIFRLGVVNGLNRELPFYLGKGETEKAHLFAQTSKYYSYWQIGFFLVTAAIVIPFLGPKQDWIFPLVAIILVISINIYISYLQGTFRANSDFHKLSRVQGISAFIKLLSLLLVYKYHFTGFCMQQVIVAAVNAIFLHIYRPIRKPAKWDFPTFKELVKTGLPIFIGSYIITATLTFPRIHLLNHGTVRMLGLYAPLFTLLGTFSVFSDSFGQFFYPRLSAHLGKTGDQFFVYKRTIIIQIGIFLLSIPFLALIYISLPYVLTHFFPKYSESKSILEIGMFVSLFLSFKFNQTLFNTIKSWGFLAVYIGVFAGLQYFIPILLMNKMDTLYAVVYGQLYTYAAMFFISIGLAYWAVKVKIKKEVQTI